MPRYRLLIEYDGGPFHGWQRLGDQPSVQIAIERALFRYCGEQVTVTGAGRTDARVHAAGQVAHVDLARDVVPDRLRAAVNHHLRPEPVAILEAVAVADDFHARFSAVGRRYRYRIVDRRAPLALEAGRAWHVPNRLDTELMHEAAQVLVGHHDFTSFRASHCQARSPVKTLNGIHVMRTGDVVTVDVWGRSFLHHQVRNIVGTLKLVGDGKLPVDAIAGILAARRREAAGQTAPAHGLCLMAVDYAPGPGVAGSAAAGSGAG